MFMICDNQVSHSDTDASVIVSRGIPHLTATNNIVLL
jgi:hypothetical protein